MKFVYHIKPLSSRSLKSMRSMKGFSLPEVLISIVLGLVVILLVVNVFLASNRTIAATQASSKIQENMRITMELFNRDFREAGANPCSSSIQLGSTLNNGKSAWWQAWERGMIGFDGTTSAPGTPFGSAHQNRVSGTDAIDVFSAVKDVANVVSKMPSSSAEIAVDSNATFSRSDLALICDTSAAFIFQITQVNGSGTSLQHNSDAGSPGNCAKVFSYTDPCVNSAVGYLFGSSATVSKISSTRWYIGYSDDGQKSLFRADLSPSATGSQVSNITEIAKGIESLSIDYKVRSSVYYVDSASVSNWKDVVGIRVKYVTSVRSESLGKKDGKVIRRNVTQIVTLRNRG